MCASRSQTLINLNRISCRLVFMSTAGVSRQPRRHIKSHLNFASNLSAQLECIRAFGFSLLVSFGFKSIAATGPSQWFTLSGGLHLASQLVSAGRYKFIVLGIHSTNFEIPFQNFKLGPDREFCSGCNAPSGRCTWTVGSNMKAQFFGDKHHNTCGHACKGALLHLYDCLLVTTTCLWPWACWIFAIWGILEMSEYPPRGGAELSGRLAPPSQFLVIGEYSPRARSSTLGFHWFYL